MCNWFRANVNRIWFWNELAITHLSYGFCLFFFFFSFKSFIAATHARKQNESDFCGIEFPIWKLKTHQKKSHRKWIQRDLLHSFVTEHLIYVHNQKKYTMEWNHQLECFDVIKSKGAAHFGLIIDLLSVEWCSPSTWIPPSTKNGENFMRIRFY